MTYLCVTQGTPRGGVCHRAPYLTLSTGYKESSGGHDGGTRQQLHMGEYCTSRKDTEDGLVGVSWYRMGRMGKFREIVFPWFFVL